MTLREWYWLELNNEELPFVFAPTLSVYHPREVGGQEEGGLDEKGDIKFPPPLHLVRGLIQFFLPSAGWLKIRHQDGMERGI